MINKALKEIILAAIIICLISLIMIIFSSCEPVWGDEIDDLIPFVIKIESNGNPHAVSKAGCIGLMQINPKGALAEWNEAVEGEAMFSTPFGAARWRQQLCNEGDLFDPTKNVFIGEWYLRRLKNYYLKENYTIERMLHAWNGGITKLRKLDYDCSKMPRESRKFSKKVLRLYKEAQKQ